MEAGNFALCSPQQNDVMKFVILMLNLWLEHQVFSRFTKVTKRYRKGKPPPCLEFHEYSDNKKLCVVACIDKYFRRSAHGVSNVKINFF